MKDCSPTPTSEKAYALLKLFPQPILFYNPSMGSDENALMVHRSVLRPTSESRKYDSNR